MPKGYLIHQIWLQGRSALPSKYEKYVQTYEKLNPDSYMFWDESTILKLLGEEHSDLIETYNSYPFWVMKVDLAKYVILEIFGGFYIDMDTNPKRSFSTLVTIANDKPMVYKKTDWNIGSYLFGLIVGKNFINNNFIFSPSPKHPLFQSIICKAKCMAKRQFYDFKILQSTGPYLLMRCIEGYEKGGGKITYIDQQTMKKYFIDEEARTWLSSEWFDIHDRWTMCAIVILLILLFFVIRHKNSDKIDE